VARRFAIVLLLLIILPAHAEWNQWRGENRNGFIAGWKAPATLPEQIKQVWSTEIGIGHSSPVISGKSVYTISRIGEQEIVASRDLASGKLQWKDSYDASYSVNPAAFSHGPGPKSTPLVAGGKLFTFGISGVLSCYDSAAGKLLWRNDFKKEFPVTSPDFGTAMSPALQNGLLIVHAGGPSKGAIFAMDPSTGKPKWRWDGDGPAYASPIVVTLSGTQQVVTQTQKQIVGIAITDGTLLWQIPFTTEYEQNSVTPALYKDLLIFSGVEKGLFAVLVTKKANQWIPETVWKNDRASMYLSSPVVVGDFVYGMTHYRKGQFFCIDARTGITQWTSNGAEGDNAAAVSTGDLLLFLNTDGELTITKASSKAYEPLKKYTVAKSPTWAHPAFAGPGQILIKDQNSLTLWSM
jgi:outer membrane protein assembly factor BamB